MSNKVAEQHKCNVCGEMHYGAPPEEKDLQISGGGGSDTATKTMFNQCSVCEGEYGTPLRIWLQSNGKYIGYFSHNRGRGIEVCDLEIMDPEKEKA